MIIVTRVQYSTIQFNQFSIAQTIGHVIIDLVCDFCLNPPTSKFQSEPSQQLPRHPKDAQHFGSDLSPHYSCNQPSLYLSLYSPSNTSTQHQSINHYKARSQDLLNFPRPDHKVWSRPHPSQYHHFLTQPKSP